MKVKFKNENYIQIPGFAICDYKLVGNELLIFGIIHGFSQVEGNYFTGSLSYLQSATNSSRNTVIKSLKNLVDKGFIIREEVPVNSVMFVRYKFSSAKTELVDKSLNLGSAITDGGSSETAPNNTNNNTNSNISLLSENKFSDDNPLLIDLNKSNLALTPEQNITKAFFDLFRNNRIEQGVTSLVQYDKTKLKSWTIHIDRMMRIDGITIQDLQQVYVWLKSEKFKNALFWRTVIFSTEKLRQQMPKLQMAMVSDLKTIESDIQKSKEKTKKQSKLGL